MQWDATAFNNAEKFQHLLLYSQTYTPLTSSNALGSKSRISNYTGGIYVPANLLSTYKNATNWSTYSDNIFPLGSYPIEDYSTISDSWETIFANESNGTYATKYAVGDTKQINATNGDVYMMEIIAMDTDLLSDNSGTAKITWLVKSNSNCIKFINTNGTTFDWSTSFLRTSLRESVLPTFPTVLQNAIKEVNKTYYRFSDTSTQTIGDTIWAPSLRELNKISDLTESSGIIYSNYFPSSSLNTSESKCVRGLTNYWTRTQYASATAVY